jgi:hypothetical protein
MRSRPSRQQTEDKVPELQQTQKVTINLVSGILRQKLLLQWINVQAEKQGAQWAALLDPPSALE